MSDGGQPGVTVAAPSPVMQLPRLSSSRGRWIIVATALGSGMVFLDGSVVNVALPKIQATFAAPLSTLQWIISAYALFLAALLLVGGALGDAYGRKKAFISGLTLFTLSSIACGLAPTANLLIAARAVQGVGGALLVPGSLAMIKATIAGEDSAKAIGLWAGMSGATTALGPLVGGYFVGAISWRLIFFINVPLAIVTIYATWRHVPETRDQRASPNLDWLGAAVTVIGLGGVTFGLIQGPGSGWTSGLVLTSLIVGGVALVAFPFIELRATNPMVPLGLFRSSNFTGSNLATIGVYFSFNGAFLFLVLKLQQVQGYSPLEAGAALLPITVMLLLLSQRAGGLMNRFGARLMMTAGSCVIAVGFVFFALMGADPSYWKELLPVILFFALGMVIFITPLTATVMGAVPADSVGVASGINNAVSRVAGLLAVAILGVVVVSQFESSLSRRVSQDGLPAKARAALASGATRLARDPIPVGLSQPAKQQVEAAIRGAYVNGFRWAMGTCAVLCFLSAAACVTMIKRE